MDDKIKKFLSSAGKKGGKSTLRRLGTDHFRKAGKLSAEKRWGKKSTPVDKVVDK